MAARSNVDHGATSHQRETAQTQEHQEFYLSDPNAGSLVSIGLDTLNLRKLGASLGISALIVLYLETDPRRAISII
jgi:hypothetical protein